MLSFTTSDRVPIFASTPASVAASQLTAFTAALGDRLGHPFPDHWSLHDFSVREYRAFWEFFVQWSRGNFDWSGSTDPVCVGGDCEHALFFPRLQLNYADSLLDLSVAPAQAPALIACHADGSSVRWTRGELRNQVGRLAQALSSLGLREGDRVVGVMRNDERAVVAALAVASVGATLSTAAPEMGVEAILDRFGPLAPQWLLAHTAQRPFDGATVLHEKVSTLAAALPSLEGVVRLDGAGRSAAMRKPTHDFDELIERTNADRFAWRRFHFNHPLFIMFSSGTTGRPKCIVHGAGGSLLEHLKEHRLHTDLKPGDRMYFHTSCAWMMWNWQLSALASGVELVTYDGPISSVDSLWRLVANERVTVFGTSPPYLRMCEDAGLEPGREFDLGALRAILSTGSVLYDPQFTWVRDRVKAVPLQSISGGTDILGCFVLGNPNLPVYAGEAQCKSLGLDVQAWADGAPTPGVGELVCANPFPSRPLGFFGDPDGSAFHRAYFSQNPGVWTHGDLIEFSAQGTARLHGRSDGILNVRGIKIAPDEIYRVLKSMPQISEAMVVAQRPPQQKNEGGAKEQRTILLLVLRDGVTLTGELVAHVRRELARRLSPAHVPDRIVAVDELPVTHSGKLSETAARDAVNGLPGRNAAALRNPACIEAIRTAAALRDAAPSPRTGEALSPLELQLRGIWEKRLGFAPIACDDNFFELGGNSLLGAHLLADVKRLTTQALPLASLFQAPNIRALAALLQDKEAQPAAAAAAVPVRAGTGRPVFLVHGLSGSVMECWTLVGLLKNPRPLYGLHARGLDGEAAPQERVEEMAASYVEQVRKAQPVGPYALIGFSFGGLVAFEMAQRLARAGQRVDLLCLLDTYVQQDLSWLARARHHYSRVKRRLSQLTPRQRLNFLAQRLVGAAGQLALRERESPMPLANQKVNDAMTAALMAYRPQPYRAGPVLYLRAAGRLGRHYDPLPVWREVAEAGLTIVEIPGEHLEMVGPNAPVVAAALDQALSSEPPAMPRSDATAAAQAATLASGQPAFPAGEPLTP